MFWDCDNFFCFDNKDGNKDKGEDMPTRGWSAGEEIEIKAPATQILPRISRISVCSKIFEHQLNQNKSTSALGCWPSPAISVSFTHDPGLWRS